MLHEPHSEAVRSATWELWQRFGGSPLVKTMLSIITNKELQRQEKIRQLGASPDAFSEDIATPNQVLSIARVMLDSSGVGPGGVDNTEVSSWSSRDGEFSQVWHKFCRPRLLQQTIHRFTENREERRFQRALTAGLDKFALIKKKLQMTELQQSLSEETLLQQSWKLLVKKVHHEKGLLVPSQIRWRLDSTEGPDRMRIRLQPLYSDPSIFFLTQLSPANRYSPTMNAFKLRSNVGMPDSSSPSLGSLGSSSWRNFPLSSPLIQSRSLSPR